MKVITYRITSKNRLESIIKNEFISKNRKIIKIIPTETNGYGIVVEFLIMYKEGFWNIFF